MSSLARAPGPTLITRAPAPTPADRQARAALARAPRPATESEAELYGRIRQALAVDPVSIGLRLPGALFDASDARAGSGGTLEASLRPQAAGLFLAGPAIGMPASPAFRGLTDRDMPLSLVRTSRRIHTEGPLHGGDDLGSDLTLSIQRATDEADGYLDARDFRAFRAKVPDSRKILTESPLTGGGTLTEDLTLGLALGDGLEIDSEGRLTVPKAPAAKGFRTVADGAGKAQFRAGVSDTLRIEAGSNMRIDFDTKRKSIKFSASGGGGSSVDLSGTLTAGFSSIGDSGGTQQFEATGADMLRLAAGSGLTLTFDATTKKATFSASTQPSETDTYYIHTQSPPSKVWSISHGLGKVPTGILVVRDDGTVVYPAISISEQAQSSYYTHTQSTPATIWTINHGLGNIPTGITILADDIGYTEAAEEIDQTSPWQVRLRFTEARSGKAYLSTGGDSYPLSLTFDEARAGKAYVSTGSDRPPYKHTQGAAATTWTIDHGLGRVPTQILVFDAAGNRLDPEIRVIEVSPFTLTLAFTAANAGTAYVS